MSLRPLLLLACTLAGSAAFSPVSLPSENPWKLKPVFRLHSTRTPDDGNTSAADTTDASSVADTTRNGAHVSLDKQTGTSSAQGIGKTAIVLNLNARSVTEDLEGLASSVLGSEHVFLTTTAEEAQQAAAKIIRDQYSLAIPVGGDGTLSSMINYMCDELMLSNEVVSLEHAMKALPYMGYVPLGTGNGVGSVVGCRRFKKGSKLLPGSKRRSRQQLKNTLQQLKRAGKRLQSKPRQDVCWPPGSSCEVAFEIVNMPVMEVAQHSKDSDNGAGKKGDVAFFAGVGFDSLMLDDFKAIKAWSKRTGFLTRTLSSVTGYCVALVVRTLPKALLRGKHNIQVKLTSGDNETLWVDHRRGDCVRRVPSGKELYSGTTGILAAGTSPFYGGGLKLFPFARMTTDKMHLRLGRISPLTGFFSLPSIFAGSYRDPSDRFGVIDFIGGDFEVEVASTGDNQEEGENEQKGYPFQHSGESFGHVERFRLRVVDEPVRFVCL